MSARFSLTHYFSPGFALALCAAACGDDKNDFLTRPGPPGDGSTTSNADDTGPEDSTSSNSDDTGGDGTNTDDTGTLPDECTDQCGMNLTVRLRETWGTSIITQNQSVGYNWTDAQDVAAGIAAGNYPPMPDWPDVSTYPSAYNNATWYLNNWYSWNWCCSALDWPAEYHSPYMVTIHHTAGEFGTCDEYVTWVYNYHTFGPDHGWGDVGYQLLVCEEDGVVTIYEGRYSGSTDLARDAFSSIWVIGAHVSGYNTGNVGISLVGDFSSTAPSADELETVIRVAVRVYYETGLSDTSGLYGHRDLGSTECPGDELYSQLDRVRERINYCQNECGFAPPMAPLTAPMLTPIPGPAAGFSSSREEFGNNH